MNRLKIISIIFLLSTFLFSFVISCDSTDPKPPEKPPGYQEDIPWPSLADSPWPMYHGDPQNTGRSTTMLSISGVVTDTILDYHHTSGFVVGEDSSIYFISTGNKSGLVCLTKNGVEKFVYPLPSSGGISGIGTPIITKAQNIIFGYKRTDSVYSINSNGVLNWAININTQNELSIGKDGTIYVLTSSPAGLTALDQGGNIKWILHEESLKPYGLALSPDGNSAYSLGVFNSGIALIAIDLKTRSVKWKIEGVSTEALPLVDSNGNIYTILQNEESLKFFLYSIFPSGETRWKYELLESSQDYFFNFAISKNGSIYLGFEYLYALNYSGELLWRINSEKISSGILYTGDDNILFEKSNLSGMNSLLVYNKDGNVILEISLPNYNIGEIVHTPLLSSPNQIILSYYRSNYLVKIN